jgi:hypothetical protein
MRTLKLVFLLAVLFFCNFGDVLASDKGEVDLSSDLVKKIIDGHKFIEQSTVCLSGTIIRYNRVYVNPNTDVDTILFAPTRQFQFYKNHNLARVEYFQPQEGTRIAPDHKYNDITEIVLRTKDYDYYYDAIGTSGNSAADVTRSKIPSQLVEAYLQTDLYINIEILTALAGGKIIEVLQRPIEKIESRECGGVPDALWITGLETTSKNKKGDKEYANWSITLNPNRHYALLRHEFYVKDENNNDIIHATMKIDSRITANGSVVPTEIIEECYIDKQGRYIDRQTIDIISTAAPEDVLFSESSFKETGRNYMLTDESPDGKPMSKQHVYVPQPWLNVPRNQNAVSFVYYVDWTRVCFVLAGFFMLLIAVFLFRRSNRNKDNL